MLESESELIYRLVPLIPARRAFPLFLPVATAVLALALVAPVIAVADCGRNTVRRPAMGGRSGTATAQTPTPAPAPAQISPRDGIRDAAPRVA